LQSARLVAAAAELGSLGRMNTNATHSDFIFSVTFDPLVLWTTAIVAVLIIGIVLLVRARRRRTR
jgi:hypothetical protein